MGPLCSLCLFKIEVELVEDEIELYESTMKLKEILNDLFSDKINLTENSLQHVCRSCHDKLQSFHEYYLFVLENQAKSHKVRQEFQKKVSEEGTFPEFVSVIKVEPYFVCDEQMEVSGDESIENSCCLDVKTSDEKDPEILQASPVIFDVKEKKKVGRRRIIGPRNRDTRRMRHVCKTSPEQQAQKKLMYDTITEFYEMTCDICTDSPIFPSYALLIRHCRKNHKALRVWICCSLRLYTTTKLYEHLLRHKNPNTCRFCGAQFIEKKVFKTHKCSNSVTCNECGKQFLNKSVLRDHLKTHFPQYIFCELCGRSFTKLHKFKEHLTYDHGNLPPEELFKPCPYCKALISTRNYGMKDHIRERHEKPALGPSKCEQCNKEYANEKNLKRHVREEHTFGRKYQCQQCHKRFLNPKSLKEHESIHTGLPNYICEFCDAPFKSNGNYYSHKRRLHPIEFEAQKANRKRLMKFKSDVKIV